MNKTVVVTGAGQGLGFSLVKEALKRKYNVLALELSNFTELNKLHNDNLTVKKCDVTDYNDCVDAANALQLASVDLLVNNAGIWLDRDRLKLDDKDFDFEKFIPQYEVNSVGMLKVAKAFMPYVEASNLKTVINISSEAGSIENAGRVCEYGYCMSKAAQNMASKILQNAYADKGIKVYYIHPGWMITPQGLAGKVGEYVPKQEPDQTASVLFDLAEGEKRKDMFIEIDGENLRAMPY